MGEKRGGGKLGSKRTGAACVKSEKLQAIVGVAAVKIRDTGALAIWIPIQRRQILGHGRARGVIVQGERGSRHAPRDGEAEIKHKQREREHGVRERCKGDDVWGEAEEGNRQRDGVRS